MEVRKVPFKSQMLRFIGLWASLLLGMLIFLLLGMYVNTVWLLVGMLVIIGVISAAFWGIAGIERLDK